MRLEQGYVKERLESSLRKFYGRYGDLIKQYEVSLTQMLNDILWPDHIQWQPLLIRLYTELDLYRILSGFRRTFATGVACRQGTLTPPDTWSRPFGTCICSTCWDQSVFELVVMLPDNALRISLCTFSILPCNSNNSKSLQTLVFLLHVQTMNGKRNPHIVFESKGQKLNSLRLFGRTLFPTEYF